VSIAAIALVLGYIALAPCNMAYALPTVAAMSEFNGQKLTPSIDGTAAIRRLVRPQTSRSSSGSTVKTKRYPGGALVILNANPTTDLKSKTIKVGVGDEVDEWAADLDGQGDPWALFEKRLTAFHATGDHKLFALSTPSVAGASRIDALYTAGDRRCWHIRCPGCGTEIQLDFFKGLKFERRAPHRAHYVAQCCGTIIEHHQKAILVREGRFIPTNPEGRFPSFHVDALISQLTTWDQIAKEWCAADGSETALKAFWNQTLGLPYEARGDAPDFKVLMARREPYEENRIPAMGLVLVAGVDVQHSGLWVEVVAFEPQRQSWSISKRFLDGDTIDPDRGAWAELAKLYEERFEDAFGNQRVLDGLAIDAGDGGRYNQVLHWCRFRPRAYAIKGVPDWGKPAFGTPSRVQVGKIRGKEDQRAKQGRVTLYPVGTWDLKSEFYAEVAKVRGTDGEFPPGFCHFGDFLDEGYFRQITAETLADAVRKGRRVKVWQAIGGANHFLDCRIYAKAMAERLGLTKNTQEDWRALAKRYTQLNPAAADLHRSADTTPEGLPPPPPASDDRRKAREEIANNLDKAIADKRSGAGVRRGRRVISRGV